MALPTTANTISHLIYSTKKINLMEADILLAFVLKRGKEYLYAHPEKVVTANQAKKYNSLCNERAAGVPIAYLVGSKEFYGLDFIVTPDVLIPRPDTEVLVEVVAEYTNGTPFTMVDVGTGSGAIAIAVKHLQPKLTMYATDISKKAVTIARKNAKLNNVDVTLHTGDVLQALPKPIGAAIDIITFNAPYLTKTEAGKKMLAYEPQVALTPTGKPTELIERMFKQLAEYTPNWQAIFLEIGHRQANQVAALADKYTTNTDLTVIQDLGGFDRVVQITR